MGLTPAAGHPNYSGKFIPEIWSGKLLAKFYETTVLFAISNSDHEGEIKNFGDKVNIRQTPDIVIRDYQKAQNLLIQRPEADIIELNIDKGKYFNFIVEDVDKFQSDVKIMSDWSRDASEQMKIEIDKDVLQVVYADAHAKNKGATAGVKSGLFNLGIAGTPVELTKANILDFIVDLGTVLDEQSVPEDRRWLIMPPIFCGMIKKSELKDASLAGDGTSILRNGRLGMIDRFTIYSSNHLFSALDGSDLCFHMMAGHPCAISFAAQITNMETLRAESTFGNLVRGLNVYGYKVVKPEGLCDLYATQGAA